MAFDYSVIARPDWTALKAAGVVKPLADGKTLRLDRAAASTRIAQYVREHAEVSTEQEFAQHGVSLAGLTQYVFGLPATASEEAKAEIQGFIKSRLPGTSTGDVQSQYSDGWLIKGKFTRQYEDTTDGSLTEIKADLWAYTQAVDLIVKYAVLPAHKRVLSSEKGSLRDAIEQAKRVPEAAVEIMAVQAQREALVSLGTATARKHLTAGMSTEQVAEFDAAVAGRLVALNELLDDHRKAIEAA
jgi:hypothetical protein